MSKLLNLGEATRCPFAAVLEVLIESTATINHSRDGLLIKIQIIEKKQLAH